MCDIFVILIFEINQGHEWVILNSCVWKKKQPFKKEVFIKL